MRKVFSGIVLLSLALNAWSYNERGNSGFTVICDNPEDNKFYDAYEAEARYNLKPVYPEFGERCEGEAQCLAAAMVIARRFLQRLPAGAKLKQFAMARLGNFIMEVNIKDKVEILPIDDVGTGIVPTGCELRQTIMQREPKFPEDMRYVIANDYWKLISTEQKAVGIVHELLYGYYAFLKIKPDSSENVRYLNALIISGKIESYDPVKYRKLLEQVYGN